MAAPTSFPRGKKPQQAHKEQPKTAGAKKRKHSSADVDGADVAAAPDALFGKKGVAATGGVAVAKTDDKKRKASKKPRVDADAALTANKPAMASVLTFKGLKKGMLLLGCVRQVNNGYDLLVSLSNKLTGTVSLAECSDEFFAHHQEQQKQKQRGPKKALANQDDEGQDKDEENVLPKLSAIFSVGQFVPVVVLGTAKENKHKQIHLSLRLSLVHAELSPQIVTKGMALHASVSSVEDHGAIVNFGIRGLNAFIPRKDLPSIGGTVRKGQLLYVSVVSMNTHTNTATVTPERSQVVKAVTRGDSFTLKQLVPGMLLNVRVEDVLSNGLSVNFLTFFTATVEQNHMSLPCRHGWEGAYRKGIKGRARIISIDAINKQITLSMAPHVVHLQVPESTLEVGDVVEKASIERIDTGIGMLLSLETKNNDGDEDMDVDSGAGATKSSWKSFAPAYVHISNLADDHVDKIEKKFSVGESVKCRVIGFAPFDGLVMVSCKQSSLQQSVLRHKDLTPGMKVNGKILAIDTWGILLEISEGVRGVIPAKHVPPFVALKKANKKNKGDSSGKYQVGRTIAARVLRVDMDTKKTYLTMKKALVTSELPVLASFEDAKMGFITHGFITKIADYGVVVTFYNNVYGLVPAGVLRQAGVTNLEEAYVLGQVVKTCVTRCDVSKQRLTLSFNMSAAAAKAPAASSDPVTSTDEVPEIVGQTVKNVKIVDVEASCFRVQTPDGMDGVLPFVQLTDFPRQTALVDSIVSKYSAGNVIDTPVLAISQAKDGVVTFSMKPLLLSFAASNKTSVVPKVFSDVKADAVLVGFVASVNANKGVFVKFLNNLVAVAPKAYLTDKFTTEIADGMFEMGETVVCHVEKLDAVKQQFVVGFRHRENFTRTTGVATPAFFEAYASEAAAVVSLSSSSLAVGKAEKGEFLGVRPYGAVFSVEMKGEDTAATVVVPADQADSKWEEGARVKLVATDYDFEKRVYYGSVDDTLVQSLSSKNRNKSQKTRLSVGTKVEAATVVAVGANQKYVVVSFASNDVSQLGVVQLCDFWSPSKTSTEFGISVGSSIAARVVSLSLKSGASFNPFQDLPLLAYEPEDVLSSSKRGKSDGVGVDATSTTGLPKYSPADFVVGKMLTGRIAGIKEAVMEIRLKTSKKHGKVITNVSIADVDENVASGSVRHPFDRFQLHDMVTGRIIAVTAKGANKLKPVSAENPAVFHMLQLSLRAADVNDNGDASRSFVRPEWAENSAGRALLQEGAALEGVVFEHLADSLVIKLSHRVSGYVGSSELSDDVDIVNNFRAHFPVGKRVKAYVFGVDEEKQRVEMSLVRSSPLSVTSLKPGSVVVGVINTKIKAIKPPAVMVQLGAHVHGRVCATELLPPSQWQNAMHELPQFATKGKAVRCVVLSASKSGSDVHIDLSLREDALENPQAYMKTLEGATPTKDRLNVGDLVTGIVSSTTKSGCFVRLDRDTTARVLLRELSDNFVKDPIAEFPAGKLVAGRVTKKSAHGIELSLKASVVSEDVAQLKWSDLAEGMTVKGTITKVQTYGVFIKIDKSAISGLCHISEVADERVTQALDQIFAEGDYVKAKILKIEDRRVSFGLKPSYFEGEESSSEEEDDEEESEEDDEQEEEAELMEVDEEEDDEEEKVQASKPQKKAKTVVEAMEVDDSSSSDEEEDDEATNAAPVEFTWDGFANVLGQDDKADSSDDDSDDDEEDAEAKAAASKKGKKSKQSDEWIALREKALANNDDVPQSASDYERLLAVSPHSSFLWIQYMAFHVSLTEVALARDVAVRATSAVSFRDEKEKLNVWVAYMNLEHDFGDDASFLRVFNSALQVNHPKRVYLHLVDLYARANELEDAEQTLATMQKKFRKSKQTWLRALQFYVVTARKLGKAAETLQRALQSLAAHKHLPVILKYGQLMYESGELDKARTIFEGILANYPKRVDLWNVYVDKEIKFGLVDGGSDGVARVRVLFERLLAMDFSAKKMKFWFKKFLQFEQAHGDERGVAHVQQLAKDFVASAAGKQ